MYCWYGCCEVTECVTQNKQHSIQETLILPASKVIVEALLGPADTEEIMKVPLANNTSGSRIMKMSRDNEHKVNETLYIAKN
jgi:hypothetical protein